MQAGFLILYVVVAMFSFIYGRIWLRRYRGMPLRRELEAQEVTFRARLDRVTVVERGWLSPGGDLGVQMRSPVELAVRGDTFEVSSALWLNRALGLDYFFRASGTSVELNRAIPRIYGEDTPPRIIVRGWRGGKKIQLTIKQKNDPLEIWNALIAAGAVRDIAWITPTREE